MDKLKERIELLIATKGMTNAVFAESIGVQPSNISHILSGRNKPSLDLVTKILERFKEVRTEWLINGKGSMTGNYTLFDEDNPPAQVSMARKADRDTANPLPQHTAPEISQPAEAKNFQKKREEIENEEDVATKHPSAEEQRIYAEKSMMEVPGKKIEKMVIFYNDRTFTIYSPES
ncbi:MAG: XRE family transcriptional regulator [Clostridia bacterium]|nr:XRE family transcriptional regulator [Clostridia bacterium]